MITIHKVMLGVALFASAYARADDLSRDLAQKCLNKVFVLKNFYSGEALSFDSSGHLLGSAVKGDWTEDGIVEIEDIRISHRRLEIYTSRVLAFADHSPNLELARVHLPLRINIELGTVSDSRQVESAFSQIFLTEHDRFLDLIPEYWKPCVKLGLSGVANLKYQGCHFSKDLAALLGSKSYAPDDPALSVEEPAAASQFEDKAIVQKVGNGVSPPRAIRQREPEFSNSAHLAHLSGIIRLGLVVGPDGLPTQIRVLKAVGAGLEAQGVRTLQGWKFDPARKNGEPVPVEISVEFNFHFE